MNWSLVSAYISEEIIAALLAKFLPPFLHPYISSTALANTGSQGTRSLSQGTQDTRWGTCWMRCQSIAGYNHTHTHSHSSTMDNFSDASQRTMQGKGRKPEYLEEKLGKNMQTQHIQGVLVINALY